MNFMSYVAEVSRGWDEPNARDMGRMTSQPNAKGEMYILNDGIDMKAKIAAMAKRLEELEMKKMQEVQAISQTPLQAMPCAICLSYEHLVDECPTIPAVREMFGDCNTYNSNWRDHPNFSWKPQPPQYKFANLNTVQEKGNFPSQPHQNQKGIHEMEANEGESSQKREVKAIITLRSGKEVDLPTSKLEHNEESKAEKKRGRKSKERERGKVIPQLGDDLQLDSQLGGDFATWFVAAKIEFQLAKWHTCACRWFGSCETPCEISQVDFISQLISQLRNGLWAAKFSQLIS
ncbi:hypothetical protein CK203_065551 [Vitis vinifera]|uniref:Uncharacterized protein n=1 Tax=Vitis vinifera TaxID=29760 RepID=A0A438G8H0_VITVI|nr:hypothetical protein CK203_065551 [Vitis vinifera]